MNELWHPNDPPLPARGLTPPLLLPLLVCLAVRLLLSSLTRSSEDAVGWADFALSARHEGLLGLYQNHPSFNHPPLMGLLAHLVLRLSDLTGLPFPFNFRLLPILADALILTTLSRVTARPWVPWLYALDPISILVSAHHTNTDCIYAALTLLGVLSLTAGRDLRAGLLFALAVNVKLIPVLVLLPFAAALPLPRLSRVALGAFPGIFPFAVLGFLQPPALFQNILSYNGTLAAWGPGLLVHVLHSHAIPALIRGPALHVGVWYHGVGRYILLAALVLLGLLQRREFRPSAASQHLAPVLLGATAIACFLAIAPSFAPQYTVLLLPFLLLTAPRNACIAWSLLAGGHIALGYAITLYPTLSETPLHASLLQGLMQLLGLLAWSVPASLFLKSVGASLSRGRTPPHTSPQPHD